MEDVLQLSEELALAELPDDFQATALRELEQEACTQLTELLQNVLRLARNELLVAENENHQDVSFMYLLLRCCSLSSK